MSLSLMIGSSPIAAVMSDPRLPDNPIVECNEAFERLTGYRRDEIIGHNCRFLAGADTEPWLTEMLRNGIRRRQPVMVEILNYKRNGTPFRNAVMVAPIFDANGDLEYFLGSQVEIAEDVARANDARRKEAHDRVTALSRRQREVLLHMAAGKLNKQIAYELELSERTVKMHRAAVIGALGAKTSADAIRIAIEAGY
ncbi:PAS domain-containing protein [Tsuneonella rigui]|jgi:PAS domain S-box-containing protein|uniref:PAS domain-containing protein n=1 Tax=Tsuneonella rigui TaxID=1708790 RepID=UPI000F7F66AA|nr:PAS domain-containing protein [Tsuneonella rigui]